jgi:hypothetical protein
MGNLDNGGYAFPIPNADFQTFKPNTVEEYKRVQSGMTLRDYFAAKAIGVIELPTDYVGTKESEESYKRWAQKAYRMADAMLKARE